MAKLPEDRIKDVARDVLPAVKERLRIALVTHEQCPEEFKEIYLRRIQHWNWEIGEWLRLSE